jgi:hypothetical protein
MQQALDQLVRIQQATAQHVAEMNRIVAGIQAGQRTVHGVKVMDVEMSFGAMIAFMVKWAIAAIPAFLFLALLVALFSALMGGCFGALGSM